MDNFQERLSKINRGSWSQLIALAGQVAAERDALQARIDAALAVVNKHNRYEDAYARELRAVLVSDEPAPGNMTALLDEDGNVICSGEHRKIELHGYAERIVSRHLSRLAKRDDWAEDDTAVGGQGANIVRQLSDAGLLAAEPTPKPPKLDPKPWVLRGETRYPLQPWHPRWGKGRFAPRPADEDGNPFSQDRAAYEVQP